MFATPKKHAQEDQGEKVSCLTATWGVLIRAAHSFSVHVKMNQAIARPRAFH